MTILRGECNQHIYDVVEKYAKYQKVMLVFDEGVSCLKTTEVYNFIKDICIFNQCNCSELNDEIFNGYKLLVFICSTDSFLKIKIKIDEFLNVFCPTDCNVLPFLVDTNNRINNSNNFVIVEKNVIDVSMVSSLIFNKFFNMMKNLNTVDFDCVDKGVFLEDLNFDVLPQFENLDENDEFIDVDILRKCSLNYKLLPVVDIILIDAFLIVFQAVKQQQLSLVDVYKSCREDYDKVDRFYAMINNENFASVIKLNFSFLTGLLVKYKSKIKDCLDVVELCDEEVESVLFKNLYL